MSVVHVSGVYFSYGNDGSNDSGGSGERDGGIDSGGGNGDRDGGGHNGAGMGDSDKGDGGAVVANDGHIFGGKMTTILDGDDSDGGVSIRTV